VRYCVTFATRKLPQTELNTQGTIIDAVINCPGSWHDAHTAQPIFERLRDRVPDGYFLVADTAFPRGTRAIAGKIKAPLKAGQYVSEDPEEQTLQMGLNEQLLSYRQTAEWGMRTVQGSFGRLRKPLKINDATYRTELLELVCRLTNIRALCVGISQIQRVYDPLWRDSADDRFWKDVEEEISGTVRRRSHIDRFRVIPDS
jgi:hypothetical protein